LVTADGIPYYDISSRLFQGTDRSFDPGEILSDFYLQFFNPEKVRFTYELVIFGYVNQGPQFTSDPVLQVAAGGAYQYDADAVDPEDDTLIYQKLIGPQTMGIDPNTGEIAWETTAADAGLHSVLLWVSDPDGLHDEQAYDVFVTDGWLNQPPRFTSTPVGDAYVNLDYAYLATATDPDGDQPLVFSLVDAVRKSDGTPLIELNQLWQLDVDFGGLVTWIPPAELVGETISVLLEVDDGHGGTARQPYEIYVYPEPGNAPPHFVTEPTLTHVVPGFTPDATPETVWPQVINLELEPGQTTDPIMVSLEVRTYTGEIDPPEGNPDKLTVYNETDALVLKDMLLRGGTSGLVVTQVNRAGHGTGGASSTGYYVNNNETYEMSRCGIVLSSGNARDYDSGSNKSRSNTTSYSYTKTSGSQEVMLDSITGGRSSHYDATQYDVYFDLLPGYDTLTFDVVFGSEEYPEWVGKFVDGFGLFVNGENIAFVDQMPVNIDHPGMTHLIGTELDGVLVSGGSPVLTFTKTLTSGATGNRLTFIVADRGDTILDTTVFISNLGAITTQPIDVDLQASEPGVGFENLSPIQTGLLPGDTATFDAEFTGGTTGEAYQLQFIDASSGGSMLLETIPVSINNDYFYPSLAVDPDGDVLTYSLAQAPSGATIDAGSGLIQWDPPATGDYPFVVVAADGRGGVDEQPFMVTVTDSESGNQAPAVEAIPDMDAQVSRAWQYAVQADDPDGDALKYYFTDKPAGMSIDPDTGLITWLPIPLQADQQYTVSVLVTDRRGGEATDSFVVTVLKQEILVNAQPEITSTPVTAGAARHTYFYAVTAEDDDADKLTYALPTVPETAGIDPDTGHLVWLPGDNDVGWHVFVVAVEDGHGGVDSQLFWVEVTTENERPQITSWPTGPVAVNTSWTYQVVAEDPNGDVLKYYFDDNPVGMSIDSDTGAISWTPDEVGDYRVELFVDDGRGGVAIQSFTLPVGDNAPPDFDSTPDGPAIVGELWLYDIIVTDPNGDTIEVTLDEASDDRGMHLMPSGQNGEYTLSWTPMTSGDFEVVLTAEDSEGGIATQTFTLPVRPPVVQSEPPEITSSPTGPAFVNDPTPWSYTIEATDPDDVSLDFDLVVPDLLVYTEVSWDESTHTVTWAPTAEGSLSFTLSVTDSSLNTVKQTFTVPAVAAPASNDAPEITSIASGPAVVGVIYEYQVKAYDPNGDDLTYSVTSTPTVTGLSINDGGLLTWNAPQTVGDYEIEVTVSDGSLSRTQTFTLPAIVPNTAPEITSQPTGPAYVGQDWTYTITATDLDDDASLAYVLVAPASGVTWNATTHTVTWNPDAEGELAFTLRVTDSDGAFDEQIFTVDALTAPPANGVPQITSVPTGPAIVGQVYDYQVVAVDDDPLNYIVSSTPQVTGLTIGSGGLLRWNTPQSVGTYEITVTVSDGTNDVFQVFDLSVVTENHIPSITTEPEGPAYVGQTWSYVLEAFDLDGPGDTLTWSLEAPASPPAAVTFTPATRTLAWLPTAADDMAFTVRVTDSHGAYAEQTFTVTAVTATSNLPPVIRSIPTSPTVLGETYVYQVDAYDPNGGDLGYFLDDSSRARGMHVSDEGLVSWTPALLGDYPIVITVDDDTHQVQQSYTLTVVAPTTTNNLPKITSTPTGPAVLHSPYTYQATAEDIDGDTITWSLDDSAVPADALNDLTIGAASGLLEWTPIKEGSYQLKVIASDGTDQTPQTFTLSVLGNAPPQIHSTPPRQGRTDQPYTYAVDATDPNPDDTLTYNLEGAPDNITISQAGLVTWPVPVQGIYTITVVVTDPDGGADLQTYHLNIANPANNDPPVINSDPRDTIQAGMRFLHQVDASDPEDDWLTYELGADAPAGMIMDDRGLIDWTPTSDDIATSPHSYTVEVSDGINTPVSKTFQISVVHELHNDRPVFDTTPRTNIVVGERYLYDADATDPDGDTITYSLLASPGGMTIDSKTGLVEWHPEIGDVGQYEMKVLALDSLGMGTTQTVTLTVRATNRPPIVDSDPVVFAAASQPYTYQIVAHDPDGHAIRFEEGDVPTSLTVDEDTGLVEWTAPWTTGVHSVQIFIYDELGLGFPYQYNVQVVDTQPNSPPEITSNPPLNAEVGLPWIYPIETTDADPGDTVTVSVTEPDPLRENMTFENDTITWTPEAELLGQLITFDIAASDGTATSKQWFTVAVHPANSAPTISAIDDQTVTVGKTFRYSVQANDPNGDPLEFELDPTSEGRGMAIDNNGRINWVPTAGQISTTAYPVTVYVTDDRADPVSTSFEITVTADLEPPVVTILPQYPQANIGAEITILVHAVDNIGVQSRTLTLTSVTLDSQTTTLDRELALDGQGKARLELTADLLGTITFDATATDTSGNPGTADSVTVDVLNPFDGTPPDAVIVSPDPGNPIPKITAPISIVGSVSDDLTEGLTWTLDVVRLEDNLETEIASGTGQVDEAFLGTFDPTMLRNGFYRIDLTAQDQGGNLDTASRTVEVEGNLKLGNFTLSFVDLELSLVGLPITISRSYDTLDATIDGDFGYGWSLDISNTKVAIDFGDGVETGPVSSSIPFEKGTRVIITLPDGTKEGFTFWPKPTSTGIVGSPYYTPDFIPDPGVKSQLIVPAHILYSWGDDTYFDMNTLEDYTPVDPVMGGTYTLKLRNGNDLVIDALTGDMTDVIDTSGNSLTYTRMGIIHSSGRSVTFERNDPHDFITAVIDPAGNRIEYGYDSQGNLISVTDRAGATTTFTYLESPDHYLDQVIDPYGRPAARTEYNDAGRIKTVTDADGQTVEFEWNASSKIQKITNQLGHTSIIETDARGNVVRQEDPEGGIVLSQYDTHNNLLSQTIVVGQLDTPENGQTNDLTTTYTYDPETSDKLTETNPRGIVTTYTYNTHGQLTSTNGPGVSSSISYDDRGLLSRMYDANGQATHFDHDDRGNLTSMKNDARIVVFSGTYNKYGEILTTTPAAGPSSYFDYDINGNQVAAWTFGGQDTDQVQILNVTIYDEMGRVDGSLRAVLPHEFITENLATAEVPAQYIVSSNSTTYNYSGQVLTTTDQYGRVTENTYDFRGQQIQTRTETRSVSAGTVWLVSRTVHDAAGQAVLTTDQYIEGTADPISGTRTTYDKAGRAVKTERLLGLEIGISAGESFVQSFGTVVSTTTHYNNAGRVTLSVDNYGTETRTTYNQYGEVVQTATQSRDENGQLVWLVSRTIYDSLGRVEYTTDRFIGTSASPDDITGVPTPASQTIYDSQSRTVASLRLENVIVDIQAATGGSPTSVLIDAGTELSRSETIYDQETGRTQTSIGRHAPGQEGPATDSFHDNLGRQIATLGPAVLDEQTAQTVRHRTETHYDPTTGRVAETWSNIRVVVNPDGSEQDPNYENRQVTIPEYDAQGRTVKTTRQGYTANTLTLSIATQTRHDDQGRVIAESDPYDALTQTVTWSETDQSYIDTVDSNAIVPTKLYGYDLETGQLTSVTLPAVFDPLASTPGNPVYAKPTYEYAYDERGNQTLIRDPLGHETRFTYDPQGRQESRTLPLGFGDDGIQGTADDPASGTFTESFEYDDLGRTLTQTSFEGIVTRFIYDDVHTGRLTDKLFFDDSTTYANWQSDAATYPPREKQVFSYDARGRVIQTDHHRTDASVDTFRTFHDDYGRVIREESPTGDVNYEYNPVSGRRERTFTGASGTYAGDQTDPVTEVTHDYDEIGRLKRVNAVERNDLLVDSDPITVGNQPETTRYYYDSVGNLDRTDLPNGAISDYEYDPLNRLDTLTHYEPDATPEDLSDNDVLSSFSYDVGADGKRNSATETFWLDSDSDGTPEAHTSTCDWVYDDLGRLASETIDHWDDQFDRTESFIYDLVGNRTRREIENTGDSAVDQIFASNFDANDRLITETADLDGDGPNDIANTTTYAYDHTQQTQKIVWQGTDTTESTGTKDTRVTYSYNDQGRLGQVLTEDFTAGSVTARTQVSYEYSTRGIRITTLEETDADNDGTFETRHETRFLVDQRNHTGYAQTIEETVVDADTGNYVSKKVYVFGHDELTQTEFTYDGTGNATSNITSETTHTFLHDGHGSVRVLLDAAAAIAQLFTYTAYGELLAIHNAQAALVGTTAAAALTSLLYSGEFFDAKLGQQYLRARWYDLATGRFNRLDPFMGSTWDPQSLHKYLYVHADPVNGLDPSGLFGLSMSISGLGARMGMMASNLMTLGRYWFIVDRLTTAIDIAQMMIQLAVTGTVNPLDVAFLLSDLLPGSKVLRKIKGFVPDFKPGLKSGKQFLSGSSELLTSLTRRIDEFGDVGPYTNKSGKLTEGSAFWNRITERMGELGGGFVAKNLGLARDTRFVKKYHGFDDVLKKGDQFFIIEAKGAGSELASGQMSRSWIKDRIENLPEGPLRNDLVYAFNNNKLFGIVTKTRFDKATGTVLDPEYVVKCIDQIGGSSF
jgi:RHS repeat-associated protein